ncbi:O-antigen ligase family protein [Rhodococcus sp. NBC_00297]|uniref:O-antigen ligase family protein n=1 Tax=Rhodococcus sp. NBC_00297 TaxID=2976005 RepID=UPI002E2A0CC4|nr:O-antigen ligase family protein [Rhodococcus sp. NBC_00297]
MDTTHQVAERLRDSLGADTPNAGSGDRSTGTNRYGLIASASVLPLALAASQFVAPIFAYACGVLVAALLVLRSDRYALVVLVSATGCSGFTVTAFGVTFLPEHLLVAVVVMKLVGRPFGRPTYRATDQWLMLLLVLWLGLCITASLLMANDTFSSIKILAWLMISVFTLLVVVRLGMDAASVASDVCVAATCYATIVFLAWMLSVNYDELTIFVQQDYASEVLRAKGLMIEPNLVASYLCCLLVITVAYGRRIPTLLITTQCAMTGLVILASLTRTAIVVYLALILVLICKRATPLIAFTVVATTFLAVLLLATGVWKPNISVDNTTNPLAVAVADRVNSFGNAGATGTGALRAQVAANALEEINTGPIENRLFGYGTNSYPQTHFSATASDGREYLANFWVAIIYDTGYVGASLIVLALIGFAFFNGVAGLLLIGTFAVVSTTTNPVWYGYFWLTAAVVMLFTLAQQRGSKDSRASLIGDRL